MSLTLQHGRTGKYDRTSEKEQKVYELLDLLHIEYDRVDHEPAMHMDVCEEIDKVLKAATCKTCFMQPSKNRFLSVIDFPGEKYSKQRIYLRRLVVPGYPLELRTIWKNFWM